MKIVLATANTAKVREIRAIFSSPGLEVLSLADLQGDPPEVLEDGLTFMDNARKKALAIARWSSLPALADDSGLIVDALDGEPGVRSSRYAGDEGNADANNALLLVRMEAVPDGERDAHFICVLCLAAPDGRTWETEGRVDGEIIREKRGSGGFGYDPVFYYRPLGLTFAQMDPEKKNAVSHRRRALERMAALLSVIARGLEGVS